jgi:excisionase family DNA binding protein
MRSDLVSLADASVLLGVSSERVRQLVIAGDLPGVRFGNAWAVPRESVDARRRASNRRGRPLNAARAWESIVDGSVDLSNVSRYRNRGEPHRYAMSGADIVYLSGHDGVIVSGVAAAVEHAEPLQVVTGDADLYVSVKVYEQLESLIAVVPDPLGAVVIQVIPADVWDGVINAAEPSSGRVFAPRAAVALDLMESGDPRHWVAAENLNESHG